ncbi:MAG: hypothetical protein RL572_2005 [Pseudomonadota bacterium]|jgi:flagellar basal-body rod modification protein FlgD
MSNVTLPSNILTTEQLEAQKYAPKTVDQSLGRDAFLKLFTTQLKSQDPLSPMENEAFVAQLAQFSSLESMKAMQGAMETMSSNMLQARLMDSTSMLGRSVPSNSGTVIGGAGRVSQISADLPEGADSGRFVVRNAEGVVVFERAFGRQPASTLALEWNGVTAKGEEVPLGLYAVSVDIQRAGQASAARVTTNELITAVRWDEDASGLVVETETGKEINLAQLQRIGL